MHYVYLQLLTHGVCLSGRWFPPYTLCCAIALIASMVVVEMSVQNIITLYFV